MTRQAGKRGFSFYMRLAATVLMLLLVLGVFIGTRRNTGAPRFDRGVVPTGPYLHVSYPFLDPVPVSEGLTWVSSNPSTNEVNIFVLDVANGRIIGELRGGWPLAIDGRSGQILCKSLWKPPSRLESALYGTVAKFSPKLVPTENDEIYWLVNLASGKSVLVGRGPQPETPSTTVCSPAFTRAYLLEKLGSPRYALRILNLSKGGLESCELPGWPVGWWSETEILYQADGGFGIYDSISRLSGSLISAERLEKWLEDHGIEVEAGKAGAFSVWDGKAYQFYATVTQDKWLAANSFLAEIRREDRTLKLIDPNFKFGWSDHLHPDGKHYVFTGRESGDNSSAVFVRDLQERSDKMIIPHDGSYFSIPRFHEDWIVFMRSNVLWRTDLNGSNTVRLFPPDK